MEDRTPGAYARPVMSTDTDPNRFAAAEAAAAPLDLLLTDAASACCAG